MTDGQPHLLYQHQVALGELFTLLAVGPVLLELVDHYLDGECLQDWRQQLRAELRRAELLDELDVLDAQALKALSRRIALWRHVFDAHVGVTA